MGTVKFVGKEEKGVASINMKLAKLTLVLGLVFALNGSLALSTTRTALFVDNYNIEFTAGLTRELQQLQRVTPSVAAVQAEESWEKLLAYTSVAKVGDMYHMWYQCWDGEESCSICYATSTDGVTWTKPQLSYYSFGNETKTNIVLREEKAAGGGGLYFGDVLYDPEDTNTSRRFKMILFDMPLIPGVRHGSGRPGVPGICPVYASSPEGPWHRPPLADGPLLVAAYGGSPLTQPPYADQRCDDFRAGPCGVDGQWISPLSPSDVMNLMWDPKSKTYRCYHKTWIDGVDGLNFWKRAVAMSSSKDFDTWDLKRQLVMYPDEHDGPDTAYLPGSGSTGVELHGGPAWYHPTADVYLMMLEVLDWGSVPIGDLRSELAVSRGAGAAGDWRRPFRNKEFLPLNPQPNKFDSGVIWASATPHTIGNVTYFYYGGYAEWNADVGKTCTSGQENCSGIGIASMHVDRFAAMRPMNASYPAQLTTRPLSLTGTDCITVNADPRGGSVRVELLDAYGYRVHGYEAANATEIVDDDVASPAKWSTASKLPTGEFSVRLHFKGDARVFALSVHSEC